MSNCSFHDYEWHDATLKDIYIDRTKLLDDDVANVVMSVIWPDGTPSKVIFSGVVDVKLELNFRIAQVDGTETIYRAYIANENDLGLMEFYEKWRPFGLFGINYYLIETATSGSKIKIFAESFKVTAENL
jgi:hypothetical protein